MLENCSFVRGEAAAGGSNVLGINHTYVIHYTGNVRRRAHQLAQVARLGVGFSLVTGYDREQLDGHNFACVMTTSPRQDLRLPDNGTLNMHRGNPSYVSQVVKLYAALYDALTAGYAAFLIMEDDAVIQFPTLPGLGKHLASLHGDFHIVYSASYNPKGTDGLASGLYLKDAQHVPGYRGPGRMMPAAGSVLSATGAAHVLGNGHPIRGPLDMTLSDSRLNTAPKHGAYVSKPYAFVPGAFGTSGIFGGEGIASLVKEDAAKAAAAKKAAEARQVTRQATTRRR